MAAEGFPKALNTSGCSFPFPSGKCTLPRAGGEFKP